ncbi:translesion error-prone DNA polymerase V autoproteolytic subunit [Candidatus Dojkabacteria bacterium]|nr:translesion error-prone DNA polymerase V autoproteolytic subunit [Candidatus Dojkabacteria bacterium]
MDTYFIPLVGSTVSAGFPSPAEDFVECQLDISQKIIKNPSSTFLVRANGNSMKDKGIQDGDILVVDKSLEATNNSVIIAYIDGEFTVKRFVKKGNKVILYPANHNYKPITVTTENDFMVWGVVTYVLHKCHE